MIPEQYMAIIRRWFWLIGICGILAAASVYTYAVTTGIGQSHLYDASATLGVTRVLSYDGTVISGSSSSRDSDATAAAADALADWSKSPQFLVALGEALQENGVVMLYQEIIASITVTSDRGPGVIVVSAHSAEAGQAALVAGEAVKLLRERALVEEGNIQAGIEGNLDRLSGDLAARLGEVYGEIVAKTANLSEESLQAAMVNFMARGAPGTTTEEFATIVRDLATASGDPALVVAEAQASILEAKLTEVSVARESLRVDLARWEEPLVLISPVENVLLEPPSRLRKRDLAVMGGMAGLVVGWIAANYLDRMLVDGRFPFRSRRATNSPAEKRGIALG